jgi:hypothetical protein
MPKPVIILWQFLTIQSEGKRNGKRRIAEAYPPAVFYLTLILQNAPCP